MVETELGDWRRTHYSNELEPEFRRIRCNSYGMDFKY